MDLEIRKPYAAVREIGETPTLPHSEFCDCAPLSAYRKLIRAEHAQFFAANDALAVFLNLLSYIFDLRCQGRAVVPQVLNQRVQTLSIIYSDNKANFFQFPSVIGTPRRFDQRELNFKLSHYQPSPVIDRSPGNQ